jgi:hypothetical protein
LTGLTVSDKQELPSVAELGARGGINQPVPEHQPRIVFRESVLSRNSHRTNCFEGQQSVGNSKRMEKDQPRAEFLKSTAWSFEIRALDFAGIDSEQVRNESAP